MSASPPTSQAPPGFRTAPQNSDAEQSLLGAILYNNAAYGGCRGLVAPEHFYEPVHGRIFAAMAERIDRGVLADEVLLWQLFAEDETLRQIPDGGAKGYLERIASRPVSVVSAPDYARHVRDLAVKRGVIRLAEEAINRAYDGGEVGSILADARAQLDALGTASSADASPLVMLDDCQVDQDVFWTIDDMLPRCSSMVIYARGGSGKTYLGTSIALGIGAGRWFDRTAERGAVLICAFERPGDAEDRLAALRARFGYADLPVALLKLGGKRLDDQAADLIILRAKQLAERTGLPVRAVEIDTISAALGGAKEDDEGLGRLRMIGERIHAETSALVVWIHHEGKGDAMGPRGHLTLADACMVWWHVEERESGDRVVHVAKANRGPAHIPLFAFRLVPFEAARDRRGKAIELCELQLTDIEEAMASPVRRRFGQSPADPQPKLGSRQKIMMRLLEKLHAKHPCGVERGLLRSHFIADLAAEKERDGKEPLDAKTAAAIFRQTLGRLRDHIGEAGDLLSPND